MCMCYTHVYVHGKRASTLVIICARIYKGVNICVYIYIYIYVSENDGWLIASGYCCIQHMARLISSFTPIIKSPIAFLTGRGDMRS